MATRRPEREQPPPRPRKSPAAAAAAHAPWMPTAWDPADALALRRVAAGTANSIEQQRAIKWIMRCSGVHDEPYRPGGEDGRRETDFALGAANVGRQIAKLCSVDLSKLRREDVEQP